MVITKMIAVGYWIHPSPYVLIIVLNVAFTGIIGIPCFAFILYGFRYRFTEKSIEVRHLLGVSIVIPLAAIEEYGLQQCSPLKDFGGWGIRHGLGGKAYIWQGRDILRVKFDDNIVYLGHHHPESLVRKLDDLSRRKKLGERQVPQSSR